jgi:hypothetical protein
MEVGNPQISQMHGKGGEVRRKPQIFCGPSDRPGPRPGPQGHQGHGGRKAPAANTQMGPSPENGMPNWRLLKGNKKKSIVGFPSVSPRFLFYFITFSQQGSSKTNKHFI